MLIHSFLARVAQPRNFRCLFSVFPRASYLIADSAQTEYCSTFLCASVCVSVTGVTSQVFSIIWLFRPCKPYTLTNLILAPPWPPRQPWPPGPPGPPEQPDQLTNPTDWTALATLNDLKIHHEDECRIRFVYLVLLGAFFLGNFFIQNSLFISVCILVCADCGV